MIIYKSSLRSDYNRYMEKSSLANQAHYQSFIINTESLFFLKNLVKSLEVEKELFINQLLFPLYQTIKIIVQKLFMNINEIYHLGYFLAKWLHSPHRV